MKRERSSVEVAAAAKRMVEALRKRAAAGDDEAAVQLVILTSITRTLANDALVAAHAYGYSYADLGAFLGVSRQSVAERIARARNG